MAVSTPLLFCKQGLMPFPSGASYPEHGLQPRWASRADISHGATVENAAESAGRSTPNHSYSLGVDHPDHPQQQAGSVMTRTGTPPRQPHPLVPSGFECVAHPVFLQQHQTGFRSAAAALYEQPRLRRQDVSIVPPRSGGRASSTGAGSDRQQPQQFRLQEQRDQRDNDTVTEIFVSDCREEEYREERSGDVHPGGAMKGAGDGAEREVDVVCNICLSRFEQPVTLTSCLHTFCHTW